MKQNELIMDKLICLEFAILELSKLLTYEVYYDKLQPCFGVKNIHCHFLDTKHTKHYTKRQYQRLKNS